MVDEQIDARLRYHGGQLFEQLERREADRPCAVAPRTSQAEQDRAIGLPFEGLLGDRWAQHIAAEMLEPRAVTGRHRDGGVQIEAAEVCMQCTGGAGSG